MSLRVLLFLCPPTMQGLLVSMQGISTQFSSRPLGPQLHTSKQTVGSVRVGTWIRASCCTKNSEASPILQPENIKTDFSLLNVNNVKLQKRTVVCLTWHTEVWLTV